MALPTAELNFPLRSDHSDPPGYGGHGWVRIIDAKNKVIANVATEHRELADKIVAKLNAEL